MARPAVSLDSYKSMARAIKTDGSNLCGLGSYASAVISSQQSTTSGTPSSRMTVSAPRANAAGSVRSHVGAPGASETTRYPVPLQGQRLALSICVPEATVAKDAALVSAIVRLANAVFVEAEAGIWNEGFNRTTTAEVEELLSRQQLALGYLHAEHGAAASLPPSMTDHSDHPDHSDQSQEGRRQLVACICIRQSSPSVGFLGMLAVDKLCQGLGLGRHMMSFAEKYCAELGDRVVGLDLLMPTTWEHPFKARVQAWYERLGYRVVRLAKFEENHPDLAPLLAGPVALRVLEKKLPLPGIVN